MRRLYSFFTILLFSAIAQTITAVTYYKGSTIKAKTSEGVEMSFTVIDPDAKTCKVAYNCINANTAGKITIPSYVEGFKTIELDFSAFEDCKNIISIEIPYTVETIGNYAFEDCESLESISISSNVTTLGKWVFSGCKKLKTVTIPSKVTLIPYHAFYQCESLASVTFAKGLTNIDDGAFYGCSSLKSISLPDNVKNIGRNAFERCKGLTSFNGGKSLEGIADYAFYECEKLSTVALPSTTKDIGDWAFSGCTSLMTITGIANIENLGRYTFNQTPWLNSLPSGLIYIGKVAFTYKDPTTMPKNTKLDIKAGTTSITAGAFSSCSNLEAVSIPQSVSAIGIDAFGYCSNLNSISVSAANRHYDSRDNCNAIIHTSTNTLITGCNNTKIPSTVTAIGYDAFEGCSFNTMIIPDNVDSLANDAFWSCRKLKSITIGKGVRIIGTNVFSYCSSLEDITVSASNPYFDSRDNCKGIVRKSTNTLIVGCTNTVIPSSVKAIGQYAFRTCNNGNFFTYTIPYQIESIGRYSFAYNGYIRSITIGRGVKEIADGAFYGCNSLMVIRSLVDTPFEIKEETFKCSTTGKNDSIYNNAILYVPKGSRINYMGTAGWNRFKHIVEIDTNALVDGDVFSEESAEGQLLTYQVTSVNSKTCKLIGAANNVSGRITIPEKAKGFTVNAIGDRAFYNYYIERDITSVVMPNSVVSIEDFAFSYCKDLTTVNLPNQLIKIGDDAFYHCESLVIDSLPNSLESIGSWAFSSCLGKEIRLPASVTYIGAGAFSGWNELTNISVETGNPVYSSPEGSNAIIKKDTKTLVVGCKTTIIPNTVECIGKSAFNSLSLLTSINIPNSVISIDSLAFNNSGLTSIVIPSSIRSIAYCAFRYCDNLTSVTSLIQSPFSIPDDTFESRAEVESPYKVATLYVPKGKREAYLATDGWNLFEKIEEGEFDDRGTVVRIDDVDYVLTQTDKTALVKTIYADHTDLVIPNHINYNNISYEVTAIGDSVFYNNIDNFLYSVSFPSSIKEISPKAFWWYEPSAIIWNSEAVIPEGSFDNIMYKERNFLLYVNKASSAPSGVENLIVNGSAEEITLHDDWHFNCPKEFTAKKICYTHNYQMETGLGQSAGWETIALPFDVQTITHETKGELVPFANYKNETNKKAFWLYGLSNNGFVKASAIKANTPYIISMPNNNKYASSYNVAGKVTFSATNSKVYRTGEAYLNTPSCDGGTFYPSYAYYANADYIYALNVTNDMTTYKGTETPGSVFLNNYRIIYPFEGRIEKHSYNSRKYSIKFAEEENTTGIQEIPFIESATDQIRVYNLSGQLIGIFNKNELSDINRKLPTGIYIVNGKKIQIK